MMSSTQSQTETFIDMNCSDIDDGEIESGYKYRFIFFCE